MSAQVRFTTKERYAEPAKINGWDAFSVWRERIHNSDASTQPQRAASAGWDPYLIWKNRVLKDER